MGRLLRFRDLKARGIVDNWVQLRRLINLYGFPAGKKARQQEGSCQNPSHERLVDVSLGTDHDS